MVIDYKIIKAPTTQILEEAVKAHIKLGWEPQGGLSIEYHEGVAIEYAQAMVKDPDE